MHVLAATPSDASTIEATAALGGDTMVGRGAIRKDGALRHQRTGKRLYGNGHGKQPYAKDWLHARLNSLIHLRNNPSFVLVEMVAGLTNREPSDLLLNILPEQPPPPTRTQRLLAAATIAATTTVRTPEPEASQPVPSPVLSTAFSANMLKEIRDAWVPVLYSEEALLRFATDDMPPETTKDVIRHWRDARASSSTDAKAYIVQTVRNSVLDGLRRKIMRPDLSPEDMDMLRQRAEEAYRNHMHRLANSAEYLPDGLGYRKIVVELMTAINELLALQIAVDNQLPPEPSWEDDDSFADSGMRGVVLVPKANPVNTNDMLIAWYAKHHQGADLARKRAMVAEAVRPFLPRKGPSPTLAVPPQPVDAKDQVKVQQQHHDAQHHHHHHHHHNKSYDSEWLNKPENSGVIIYNAKMNAACNLALSLVRERSGLRDVEIEHLMQSSEVAPFFAQYVAAILRDNEVQTPRRNEEPRTLLPQLAIVRNGLDGRFRRLVRRSGSNELSFGDAWPMGATSLFARRLSRAQRNGIAMISDDDAALTRQTHRLDGGGIATVQELWQQQQQQNDHDVVPYGIVPSVMRAKNFAEQDRDAERRAMNALIF